MTNGSANYDDGGYVDTTYYTTEAGAYDAKPSSSPYGTYDQGGNVSEWNEAIFTHGLYRGLRGGSFMGDGFDLIAFDRGGWDPCDESSYIGFRVAQVPEPASTTLGLLGLGMVAWIRKRRMAQDGL